MGNCYYHLDRPGVFQLLVEGGGTVMVCVSCHAALMDEKEKS